MANHHKSTRMQTARNYRREAAMDTGEIWYTGFWPFYVVAFDFTNSQRSLAHD